MKEDEKDGSGRGGEGGCESLKAKGAPGGNNCSSLDFANALPL